MIRYFFTKQFFGFALVGGVTLLCNGATRILFNLWLPFGLSILVAYVISMAIAFPLHRIYIFSGSIRSVEQSIRDFILVNLSLLPFVWALSLALTRLFTQCGLVTYAHLLAHAAALVLPKLGAFLAYKFFVFRKARA